MSYDCNIRAEIIPCPHCGVRAACTCRGDLEAQLVCLLCDDESDCSDDTF